MSSKSFNNAKKLSYKSKRLFSYLNEQSFDQLREHLNKNISAIDINGVMSAGGKSLALVAITSNISAKFLELLIKHGAKLTYNYYVNGRSRRISLIHESLSNNIYQSFEKTKILIDNGADIDSVGYRGATPLIIASNAGNKDVIKLLIENSANINVRSYLFTPLITYLLKNVSNLDMEIVKMLINKETTIFNTSFTNEWFIKKYDGCKTIIEYLHKYNHMFLMKYIKYLDSVDKDITIFLDTNDGKILDIYSKMIIILDQIKNVPADIVTILLHMGVE